MKARLYHYILLLFFALVSFSLSARGNRNDAEINCDTTIWFINIYPGSEIYELEGHSALRIKTCDFDVAINYGMFSFNSPNFVYRFVKGETDYMVGAIPWPLFEAEYVNAGRRMVAHKLNLSSDQKARLIDLIDDNLKPENRIYRYNYVLDNCATRPLRMVELAVGDTLILPEPTSTAEVVTFRNYMRYYHDNYPWYQFGIDLALGNGIDREINVREKSFAPIVFEEQIDGIRIGNNGEKLVEKTFVIYEGVPGGVVLEATPWYLTPLFLSWMLSIILSIYVLTKVLKHKEYPRIAATVLYTVNGLAGLLVAFLVFISVHEATSPNVNLLWLNPLCFIPSVTLWLKKAKKLTLCYFLINFVLLLILLILWICGYQSPNAAFVPLVVTDMLFSAAYIFLHYSVCEKN